MKSRIVSIGLVLAALASTSQVSATVAVQGWWRFGEGGTTVQTDSSGNGRNFKNTYFAGNPPVVGQNAVGGPLGNLGATSTNSARFGLNNNVSLLYDTGYTPPATNYGIEIWYHPMNKDYVGGTDNQTWLFSSGGSIFGLGPGGGAVVRISDNFDGTSSIRAGVVQQGNSHNVVDFGPSIVLDTNRWLHLALVNDAGNLVFYTNGVPCATNDNGTVPLTAPAGAMFIGTDGGYWGVDGLLDEERVFTFANGEFSTNDLLYSAPPRQISQPQNAIVWNGGAANIDANTAEDPDNTFQWRLNGTNVLGQTSSTIYLSTVALADSGSLYSCAVTNNGNGLVTSNATLTVVPVQTAGVNAYRTSVTGEATLIAYFPVDGNTGSTVTDTKGGNNGTLELNASYDGQTNRSFGERAIFLRGDGDVRIPGKAAYEFASGNGTVEALVYLRPSSTGGDATIFSVASDDGSALRYAIAVSGDGSSLVYTNDGGVHLTWSVPANLLNRLVHVAVVFSSGTSVTAYVDGQSLGSQTQTGFGSATGVPAWIGSATTNAPSLWNGTIDELALYSSALSASTIAIHNSKFVYGTNTSAPTIVSQSSSKTIYAGGSPVLSVTVAGTPPLDYQWRSNGIVISGAVSSTLVLPHVTTNASAAYTVNVINSFGSTNNNSNPINITVVAPPSGYVATVMNDNPTAFWRLADSGGPTAKDSAGFNDGTYDSSGVTYNAGGPSGDPGSGVHFDGTSGRAVVPYTSLLNPNGSFTVEFWAQLSAYTFCSPISSMVRPARTAGYEFYLAGNFAGYEFHTAANGGYNMITGSGTAPTVGVWYHVVGVWDGTTITLYVDGYPIGTSSTPPFTANGATPFYIGSRSDGAGHLNGNMSDVAFYNYALTQDQIQSHVAIGLPLSVAIGASTNVIADTKPVGTPYDGLNDGAAWLASSSDGTVSRNGVIQFTSTNANSQVTDFGYESLGSTVGTIMFWMRSAGTDLSGGNEGGILFDWRSTQGLALIHYDNGTIFVQAQNNYNHFNSTALVSDNKWHHIAITYDQGAAGSVSMYVDGAFDSSANNAAPWAWPVGQLIELGRDTLYDGGYWRNYNGLMDDFRMYNRILSAPEISQAFAGSLVDTSALQVQFNFDTAPKGYIVTWPYGSLQTATLVSGPYTTITNVTSPFPVAPQSGQKFFRGLQ